jgi:hypothetical protein
MADLHICGIFRQEKALISKTSTFLVGWSVVLEGIYDGLVVGIDRKLTTIQVLRKLLKRPNESSGF